MITVISIVLPLALIGLVIMISMIAMADRLTRKD